LLTDRNRIRLDRLLDVLDLLKTEVTEVHLQNLSDLTVSVAGDANPSSLCETLKSGRDVDAVTQEVTPSDHHITDVDADSEA
jgi:hypothetical protein